MCGLDFFVGFMRMHLARIFGYLFLCLLCVLPFGNKLSAQGADSLLDKRIEYIYHFSREVTWPNFSSQEKFYVELIGRNPEFYGQLSHFFEGKLVAGKEVSVSNTQDWRTRNRTIRPNIVYVDETSLHFLPVIVRFFEGYPVLIVSSRPYMEQGWMVSFTERFLAKPYTNGVGADWGYSLNSENIELRAKLSISSRLKSGAILVVPMQRSNGEDRRGVELSSLEAELQSIRIQLETRDSIVGLQRIQIAGLRDTVARQRLQLERMDSFAAVRFIAAADFLYDYPFNDSVNRLVTPGIVSRMRMHRGLLADSGQERAAFRDAVPEREPTGYILSILVFAVGLAMVGFSYAIASSAVGRALEGQIGEGRFLPAKPAGEVERQARARHAFFANISHELRTPLNAIVGLSQLLTADSMGNADVKASLEVINQSAHGLLRTMDGIVTKAMIDAGEMPVEEVVTSLSQLFATLSHESEELIRHMGKQQSVRFRSECPSGVPDAVLLDCGKVQSVLGVLLSNAVRFTSLGEVVLGCSVGVSSFGGESILFYVHDTGRGMDSAQVAHVSMHFTDASRREMPRDDSVDGDAGTGIGLGLSIACGLTRILGTRLSIESDLGVGTRASFALPLKAV